MLHISRIRLHASGVFTRCHNDGKTNVSFTPLMKKREPVPTCVERLMQNKVECECRTLCVRSH